MNSNFEIMPGRIVISRSGRDKNRKMIVLEVGDDYLLLADGKHRMIEKPKKKKKKHVFPTRHVFDDDFIASGKFSDIQNHEIRIFLKEHDDKKR